MSTRKKALFILPLIFVMVFSLLAPLQTPVYAASDSYIVSDDYAQVKGGTLSGKLWENSKSYLYVVGDTTKYSLVKKSKSTGKVKTLVKKLPNKTVNDSSDAYIIHAIYGNYVYLTRARSTTNTLWTYKYDLKKKKLTKVSSKCGVIEQRNKYLLGMQEYDTGSVVMTSKYSLYKILNNGNIKKIKYLGHLYAPEKVGKYLYYSYHKNGDLHKAKIYRIRFNGKDKKLLGTLEVKDKTGKVYGYDFHAKWCRVTKNGKAYKYNYETKKLTRIKD